MNYKLAKQLKDAGFPNSENWMIEIINPNGDKGFVCDWELKPTLSELIFACGELVLTVGDSGESYVFTYRFIDSSSEYNGRGKTPEIAVAKLWLKLYED